MPGAERWPRLPQGDALALGLQGPVQSFSQVGVVIVIPPGSGEQSPREAQSLAHACRVGSQKPRLLSPWASSEPPQALAPPCPAQGSMVVEEEQGLSLALGAEMGRGWLHAYRRFSHPQPLRGPGGFFIESPLWLGTRLSGRVLAEHA